MLMLVIDLLGWWYSRGFAWAGNYLFVTRTKRTLEFFSVSDLLKTLFAPFRQDAYKLRSATIEQRLQALGGNLISRFLGFLIRSILILTGLVVLLFNVVSGLVGILIWPVLPILPLLCLVLFAAEVGL